MRAFFSSKRIWAPGDAVLSGYQGTGFFRFFLPGTQILGEKKKMPRFIFKNLNVLDFFGFFGFFFNVLGFFEIFLSDSFPAHRERSNKV